jgi:hypothetical protein
MPEGKPPGIADREYQQRQSCSLHQNRPGFSEEPAVSDDHFC